MRIVDLEIEDDSPLTMTTILVPNTGDYAKAWWWYTGLTVQEVHQRLTANQARLIDLEPYETSAGLRFAVKMEVIQV